MLRLKTDIAVPSPGLKILVLGDPGVGKKSLVQRWVSDLYDTKYKENCGALMWVRQTVVNEGEELQVKLWSISGRKRLLPISQMHYRGTRGVLLVFDVTNISSFNNAVFWYNEAQREIPEAVCMLVGTKVDIVDDIRVSSEMLKKQATEWGIKYFSVSAKNGSDMTKLFSALLKTITEN